jgi:hypothetical protein
MVSVSTRSSTFQLNKHRTTLSFTPNGRKKDTSITSLVRNAIYSVELGIVSIVTKKATTVTGHGGESGN